MIGNGNITNFVQTLLCIRCLFASLNRRNKKISMRGVDSARKYPKLRKAITQTIASGPITLDFYSYGTICLEGLF